MIYNKQSSIFNLITHLYKEFIVINSKCVNNNLIYQKILYQNQIYLNKIYLK